MAARRRPGLGDRWRGLEQRISEVTGLPETSYEREIYRETKSPYEQLSLFDETDRAQAEETQRTSRQVASVTARQLLSYSSSLSIDMFEEETVADVSPWRESSRNELRGPSSSTRLNGHIFIPDDPLGDIIYPLRDGDEPVPTMIGGRIYVRWIKSGRNGNVSSYGPITLSEYNTFNISLSKGSDVVLFPNHSYEPGGLPNNNGWLTSMWSVE